MQEERLHALHLGLVNSLPVSAKNDRLPTKPARKELKGKEPTRSIYRNCKHNRFQHIF